METDCIDITFCRFTTSLVFTSDISLTHVCKENNMDYDMIFNMTEPLGKTKWLITYYPQVRI